MHLHRDNPKHACNRRKQDNANADRGEVLNKEVIELLTLESRGQLDFISNCLDAYDTRNQEAGSKCS